MEERLLILDLIGFSFLLNVTCAHALVFSISRLPLFF